MRIIAGRFRGIRLAAVGKGDQAAHLRPTPDRVRESLFNMLGSSFGDPVPPWGWRRGPGARTWLFLLIAEPLRQDC